MIELESPTGEFAFMHNRKPNHRLRSTRRRILRGGGRWHKLVSDRGRRSLPGYCLDCHRPEAPPKIRPDPTQNPNPKPQSRTRRHNCLTPTSPAPPDPPHQALPTHHLGAAGSAPTTGSEAAAGAVKSAKVGAGGEIMRTLCVTCAMMLAAAVLPVGMAHADGPPTTVAGLISHYVDLSHQAEKVNEQLLKAQEQAQALRQQAATADAAFQTADASWKQAVQQADQLVS